MADTSDIRNGLVIHFNDDLFQVVQFQHVKPGKGAAFVRTKLKSLSNGRVLEHNFPAGHRINTARVERRKHQFLYKDDLGYHFMDKESFEQLTLQEEMVPTPHLMNEGQEVDILVHDETETPLSCELPPFVVMEVTYAEPGVKGDTSSTTALKSAEIETGGSVSVPLFVNTGDVIKIDTRTNQYVERVKK